MALRIEKVDHEDLAMRERLFAFLAPHEAYCLFITGNLKNDFPESHLYAAVLRDKWIGLAGYYGRPKSVIPFATDPDTARVLARYVADRHPDIDFLNAMASLAEPACDELVRLGYRVANDPRQVFMQSDSEPAPQQHEELVRAMEPADHEGTVKLLRYIQDRPQEPPVTKEELRKVRMSPFRRVLVANGQVVSTASTNGLGIAAFQILGVATALAHRAKGYARAVCASLMREMWREGARQGIIFAPTDNQPAQRCYKGLGFQATGDFWVAKLERQT